MLLSYPGEPGKMTVSKPGLWGGCGRETSVEYDLVTTYI